MHHRTPTEAPFSDRIPHRLAINFSVTIFVRKLSPTGDSKVGELKRPISMRNARPANKTCRISYFSLNLLNIPLIYNSSQHDVITMYSMTS